MGETGFAAATAVEAVGSGAYRAEIDAAWGVFGNANGGYLLAVMARAALHAGAREFPHVVSASYLRPGVHGPARVEVEVLKSGRTATHARVVLSQEQGPAIDATFVLGDAPSGQSDRAETIALPPAPELCTPVGQPPPGIDILDRIALRYAPGFDFRAPGEPTVRAWFDLLSAEAPDPLHALLAADALVPSVHRSGAVGWAPTVQLTAYLHAVPAPGPLAVQAVAGEIRDGWFDESMVVADTTGRLVVRARQLARMPR
ncbi:MAG: thioesterase family protein [Sporichthyaceae bacterium]